MRICRGAEGMKRISVRIIQSLSDYPPNMELCQVEVVIVVCAVSVYYSVEACAGFFFFFWCAHVKPGVCCVL